MSPATLRRNSASLGGRSSRQHSHHLAQFARVRPAQGRVCEVRFFIIEIVLFLEIRKVRDGPRGRMVERPQGALGSLDGFLIAASAGLLQYGCQLGAVRGPAVCILVPKT